MKVKCARHGTIFDVEPRAYPMPEYPWSKERCEDEGYMYPARVIDCPVCGRGYFQEADGRWIGDRELIIIEEDTSG